MLSIDKARAQEREIAKEQKTKYDNCPTRMRYCCEMCFHEPKCNEVAEYHEQLAEWLEELKALRNGLKIKCDNLNEALEKGKKIGYNKAIDDFAEKLIRYVDCGHLCSPTEVTWSDLSVVEMVKKLAEQLKEGVKNEQS